MEELTVTLAGKNPFAFVAEGDGVRFIIAKAYVENGTALSPPTCNRCGEEGVVTLGPFPNCNHHSRADCPSCKKFIKWISENRNIDISIKGQADPDNLVSGVEYKLFGGWGKAKPPYGKPFEFKQIIQCKPHSRAAVISYLTKFAAGIGPAYASQLWDAFGSDSVRRLRSDPLECARVLGVPLGRVSDAARSLDEFIKTEDTRLELESLCEGRGFPKTLIETVIKKWGIHAPSRIRRDPFTLLIERLPGCGFARCDTLYTDLGLPLDRLKRQFACVWKSLREDGSGNTWHPVSIAKQAIESNISGLPEGGIKWQRAVILGVRAGWLATRKDTNGRWWIAEKKQAENEATTARCVRALMDASGGEQWPNVADIDGLTPRQREQLAIAFSGPVALLSGLPGCGKTTVAALLCKHMLATNSSIQIAVASPTNMAAMRIRTELDSHDIGSAVTTTTFHRLLGVTRAGHDGGGWGFSRDENNPLQLDVMIIDEASMQDIDISASLYQAIKPGTLVLHLFDLAQLPPVSHGCPARDFVASGIIPHGHLTEVLRNSGAITKFCEACRSGKQIDKPKALHFETGSNHVHYECQSPQMARQVLAEKLQAIVNGIAIGGKKIDPIRDVQIIVALNEIGDLSRKAVNAVAREILNPNGFRVDGNPFRVGDKAICSENVKLKCCDEGGQFSAENCEADEFTTEDEADEWFTANGEIGIVIAVDKKFSVLRLDATGQHVRVPVFGTEKSGNGKFDLAYAVTFHKAQGNSWPVVFLMTDRAANRMSSRELWLTGGSRPRSLLVTIGELSVIGRQCCRSSLSERKTFLRELILEDA